MSIILAVNDDADDRDLLSQLLEPLKNVTLSFAKTADDAIESIRASSPDVIITDASHGLELIARCRESAPNASVIVITQNAAPPDTHNGGICFISRQNIKKLLALAISDQLKKSESQRQLGELKQRIKYRETHFELTNDPSLITPLVTFLKDALSSAGFCDETDRHRIGIAIQEAVDNALYHGNLELDSEICEQDMTKYYGLATERRQIDPYGERRIFITYKHSPDSIQYVIRDEGPGFDLNNLPDPTDPESMIRLTGRGLLLIRNYMDEVEHNDVGNQITMIKYRNGHT